MADEGKVFDAIVGGDLFADLILGGFPHWPEPGIETFATELHNEIGGGAAITACGLARLGSRTAVLGAVGRDRGEWVIDRLKSFGVITSQLRFDPSEPTAVSVAITTSEDRTFLTYRGSNRLFPAMLAEAVASGELTQARHVHLPFAPDLHSAAQLFESIRGQGRSISLDVGWHQDWLADRRALALLPLVDIFFPNELEGHRMTGETGCEEILRKLESCGARRVALKLGAEGAALLWDGEILRAPSYPVKPIDTTGAGDCFDAGFLHYWLKGEAPLTCLRAANFCGAASTEAYGGVAGFPDAERIRNEWNNTICAR